MARVTAPWNLRLTAVFEGPDRLTDAAVFQGRRFVGAEASGVGSNVRADGTSIGIDGGGWETDDLASVALNAPAMVGDLWFNLADATLGLWQVERGARGCVATRLGSIADSVPGHIAIGPWPSYTAGYAVAHLWYQDTCPAHGAAIWEVIDGELSDVGPEDMDECMALHVVGDWLYAAGRVAGELSEYGLWAYDGTDWYSWAEWDQSYGRPNDLWDVDGDVYIGATGAYRHLIGSIDETGDGVYVSRGCDVAGVATFVSGTGAGARIMDARGRLVAANVGEGSNVESLAGRGYVVNRRAAGQLALSRVDFPGRRLMDMAAWTGEDVPVELVRYKNRLFACHDDGEGSPRVLGFDGSSVEFADAQTWRVDKAQSGDPVIAVGRLLQDLGGLYYGVGQVVLETTDQVLLTELTHECADGTGESPELGELRHECAREVGIVRLDSVTHECGDGNGDSPELGSVAHECMTWDGEGVTPTLDSVEHECAGGEAVALDELVHECKDGVAGPGAGEAIVFVTATLDSPVRQMRIVTSEPLSGDWRAICRIDREALDVDAWESYEAAPLNANWTPTQEGTAVRVGIIGPWGEGREPGVCVNFLRE